MIKKDAYVLFCLANGKPDEVKYPYKLNGDIHFESSFHGGYGGDIAYLTDMEEVHEYIRGSCFGRYHKILICKVRDIVHLKIESAYQEN